MGSISYVADGDAQSLYYGRPLEKDLSGGPLPRQEWCGGDRRREFPGGYLSFLQILQPEGGLPFGAKVS